jgi:amino-acid N-acetyltransferase
MLVRKALLQDASKVYDLVNSLSGDGTLLKRAFAEICENIRDFTVAESDGGVFLGCGALHFTGRICARCAPSSSSQKPRARARAAAFWPR